jgi:hypothetical protein
MTILIFSRTFPGQLEIPGHFQDISGHFQIPGHFQDVLEFQDSVGTMPKALNKALLGTLRHYKALRRHSKALCGTAEGTLRH